MSNHGSDYRFPRNENGEEFQKMTDGACKYYHPELSIAPCSDNGKDIYTTCYYCGIKLCDKVAHGYHKCLKEKSSCYLCGKKSKVMTPCHNSEHMEPNFCFAYYCPDCVSKATVHSQYSKEHDANLIVECVNCPQSLEKRRKDTDDFNRYLEFILKEQLFF